MSIFIGIGVLTRPLILGLLLLGTFAAAGRAGLHGARRNGVVLAFGAILIAWYALIYACAVGGVFLAGVGGLQPAIPVAVVVPLAIGSVLAARLSIVRRMLDAAPSSWLVGLQVYRILGAVFLLQLVLGRMPAAFALPAGIGDVLTGLFAPFAAAQLAAGRGGFRRALTWNAFGIGDLLVALTLGVLTAPGRLHVAAFGPPNLAVGSYPSVMIPAFIVPLSLLLHGLSIWQLRRRTSGEDLSQRVLRRNDAEYRYAG